MKKKIVSRFFFRWRHISSSKFDQDFLIFIDGQYKLKSESSSLTKLWATKEEPKWNPSLIVEPIPKPGKPKRNSNMSVILFGRSILGIRLDTRPRLRFILRRVFSFFFFFFLFLFFVFVFVSSCNFLPILPWHYSWIPQTSLFSNFFIKNWSHSTIHTFKFYFATMFSIFSF